MAYLISSNTENLKYYIKKYKTYMNESKTRETKHSRLLAKQGAEEILQQTITQGLEFKKGAIAYKNAANEMQSWWAKEQKRRRNHAFKQSIR